MFVRRVEPDTDGSLRDLRRCEDGHEFVTQGYDEVTGVDAKDADVHNLR